MILSLFLTLFSPLPKQLDESLIGSWKVQWGGTEWEWSVSEDVNFWRSDYGTEGGGAMYPPKNGRVDFDYKNERWGMELERDGLGWKGMGWRTGCTKVAVKLTRMK